MQDIMDKADVTLEDRSVVAPARKAAQDAEAAGKGFNGIYCGAAIELPDGRITTGKNSNLLHAESAAVLNAVKGLAGVPDEVELISSEILQTITNMKKELLDRKTPCLNVEQTLIALAVSSQGERDAKAALEQLNELRDCEMHITHLPTPGDEAGLIRLRMNVTTDAKLTLLSHFQKGE